MLSIDLKSSGCIKAKVNWVSSKVGRCLGTFKFIKNLTVKSFPFLLNKRVQSQYKFILE